MEQRILGRGLLQDILAWREALPAGFEDPYYQSELLLQYILELTSCLDGVKCLSHALPRLSPVVPLLPG